ncbi:hypothetical protein D3C81_1713890 [compost metagenome]
MFIRIEWNCHYDHSGGNNFAVVGLDFDATIDLLNSSDGHRHADLGTAIGQHCINEAYRAPLNSIMSFSVHEGVIVPTAACKQLKYTRQAKFVSCFTCIQGHVTIDLSLLQPT